MMPANLPDKAFLRPDEVAEVIGISSRTVYRLIKAGRLPAVRNRRGRLAVPQEIVREMIVQGERQ